MTNNTQNLEIIEEQEANRFTVIALTVWSFAFCIVALLNELGIYYVPKAPVRIVTVLNFVITLVGVHIIRNHKEHFSRKDKYILMGLILLQLFDCLATLTFHAILGAALPIVMASFYRNRKMILYTTIASVLIIPLAFWFSMAIGTYEEIFLAYLVCLVNPSYFNETAIANLTSYGQWIDGPIWKFFLYYDIPNMIVLSEIGFLAFAVFKGKESIHERRIEQISSIQDNVTLSMSVVIENRDENTGGHVKRTSDVMKIFVNELKKDDRNHNEKYWDTVIKTAPLHDLGKISIDDKILRKTARLSEEEYEIIKTHPVKSAILIENVLGGIEDEEYIRIAKNIGRFHHEHWDGSGYPEGLKKEEIPYEARIMTYVDVLDALVSKRSYKEAYSFEKAFEIIRQDCGKMFDPGLFPAFERAYPKIMDYYKNNQLKDQTSF